MSDMFKSYDTFSTQCTPDNRSQVIPNNQIYHLPLEVFDLEGNMKGVCWNYGDAINLRFLTEGTVEENGVVSLAKDWLKDKYFELDIFDYRNNLVFSETKQAGEDITFQIDCKISEDKFIRGTYSCFLKLKLDNLEDSLPISILISSAQGLIYVK